MWKLLIHQLSLIVVDGHMNGQKAVNNRLFPLINLPLFLLLFTLHGQLIVV